MIYDLAKDTKTKSPRQTRDDHIRYELELGKRRDDYLASIIPNIKGFKKVGKSEVWVKAMDEFLKKRGY